MDILVHWLLAHQASILQIPSDAYQEQSHGNQWIIMLLLLLLLYPLQNAGPF